MKQPAYSTVVDRLHAASVPVKQLGGGTVAVIPVAGRVIALAFSPQGENLLWSNPQLSDASLVKNTPQKLVGGHGGDRLWFAPELDYYWDGAPDWEAFSNYKIPTAADPGEYAFTHADDESVTLQTKGELAVHGTRRHVGFEIERTVRVAQPPLPRSAPLMSGVDFVGIQTSHCLKLAPDTREGRIDLWHLLQIPAGATLVVPLKPGVDAQAAQPQSYTRPGGWQQKSNFISWRYDGQACVKFGLAAAALTGRTAVFRELEPGRWCMIVREFKVNPSAAYADYPYGVPRNDQAFQAWDGFGFGEMEFHSPLLDAAEGRRELRESDRLWAFGASLKTISVLAKELLGVDVESALRS